MKLWSGLITIGIGIGILLGAAASTRAQDVNPEAQIEPPPEPAPKKFEIEFALEMGKPPVPAVTNEPVTYKATVTPAEGYLIVAETPFLATLRSATLKVTKAKLTEKDFADPEAPAKSVTTKLTAPNPGEHIVRAKVSFFVCEPNLCERYTVENEMKLNVVEPAPARELPAAAPAEVTPTPADIPSPRP